MEISFDLFCRVRAHDLGAAAWPDAIRDVTLRIQFDAQRSGYLQQCPSATTEILVRDGDRVGWLIVDRSGSAIHVVDIAVVPERRGQGLGAAAVRALQDEAAAAGRPLTLSVQRTNIGAIRLYSRLGFEAVGADELHLNLEWRASAPAASAAAPIFTADLFRGALDTWFEVVQSGPPLLLPLKEVQDHGASGGFSRFSLIFHGPGDRQLPQGVYTLRHPVVGVHDIMLVPVVGSTPQRILYEACFAVTDPRQSS